MHKPFPELTAMVLAFIAIPLVCSALVHGTQHGFGTSFWARAVFGFMLLIWLVLEVRRLWRQRARASSRSSQR